MFRSKTGYAKENVSEQYIRFKRRRYISLAVSFIILGAIFFVFSIYSMLHGGTFASLIAAVIILACGVYYSYKAFGSGLKEESEKIKQQKIKTKSPVLFSEDYIKGLDDDMKKLDEYINAEEADTEDVNAEDTDASRD